ncbi:MAG TPA: acyltransferase family protein [Candidatus Nanopelagicaceae bacterium]
MRIGEIQGLRALAVLLVIAFHAKFLQGGFIGVDIFYVISGYLITGLLVRELDETGTISFRKFYSRRIKRLLPSSFLVLISTAVFGFIFMPANMRADLGRNVVATALYVGNYLFAWWQNDYQNLGATPSPVIHYWSLAVEEQFYLLWPLLILLAGRNHGARRIFKIVLSVTLGSFLLSIIATSHWPIWSFYSLPTRAWELGIGALVVFSKRSLTRFLWLPWIALAAIAYSTVKFSEITPFPGSAAAIPTVATGILLLMIHDLPRPIAYLLRTRVSQWIGAASYPLYLWHWPALVLPLFLFHHSLSSPERILFIGLTFVLAALTHHFIENPLRLSRASSRRVFSLAAVATIVSVILGVTISFSSAQNLSLPSVTGLISLKGVTRLPAIYADGCQLDKNATLSPPCNYGKTSAAKIIILFGDSHAAQWFPTLNAIALKYSLKLVVLTKSSCPAASVELPDQGAFKNAPCKVWRENSMLRIEKIHPWAVFISNYDHYQPPTKVSNRNLWWMQGNTVTVNRLKVATKQLVLIADTPWPSRDIPSCLTQNKPSSCATSRPATLLKGLESNEVIFVDPANWFCSATCPAVKDNIVVYRDASHMSVDFALHLAPDLTKILIAKHIISS